MYSSLDSPLAAIYNKKTMKKQTEKRKKTSRGKELLGHLNTNINNW
jgi:hypothetical protein